MLNAVCEGKEEEAGKGKELPAKPTLKPLPGSDLGQSILKLIDILSTMPQKILV